jgi:hypothetical protein
VESPNQPADHIELRVLNRQHEFEQIGTVERVGDMQIAAGDLQGRYYVRGFINMVLIRQPEPAAPQSQPQGHDQDGGQGQYLAWFRA